MGASGRRAVNKKEFQFSFQVLDQYFGDMRHTIRTRLSAARRAALATRRLFLAVVSSLFFQTREGGSTPSEAAGGRPQI